MTDKEFDEATKRHDGSVDFAESHPRSAFSTSKKQIMIDLCIGFNGRNSDVLSRMFFGLLRRHCDLSGVHLHVVDNGVPPGVEVVGYPPSTTLYKIKDGWLPTLGQYDTESVLPQWKMTHWIIDNCGSCEWCVLCDFDMIIRDDILAYMWERMTPNVGVIGSHGTNHNQLTPLFAINRNAWRRRRVTFEGGPGKDGKQVDLGIRLAEDLDAQGFRWVKFEVEPGMEPYYHHMGGGGAYHTRQEFESMRARALEMCQRERIP